MEQLLKTKFYIPTPRAELVPRSRLFKHLNAGIHFGQKLMLICAPAGFGKTTLVCDWINSIKSEIDQEERTIPSIAWLSLDESNSDPVRFLIYFIAALRQIEGMELLGDSALNMLRSPQPPQTEVVLTSLINEITDIPTSIILVLDDYHLIEAQPVHDALTFFIEHQPPQFHLVINTRVDLQLPVARLRARGQLTELRAADLRFSPTETDIFLNQVMGLDLSPENTSALEIRTEGWIAGLQLAAISMLGHPDHAEFVKSFTGSHQFVMDYLLEEVLEQQPEEIQNFLLKTSILTRLTGSLCEAVIGHNHGQETLELLKNSNMFIISMDDERRWFRYHHLFVDLLSQRLRQTYPELIPLLHLRASEWFEQHNFMEDAINHALYGKVFERAASLIENQFEVQYERGNHAQLRRWLGSLPIEFVLSKASLCILNAWNLFTSGKIKDADRCLQAADEMLDQDSKQAQLAQGQIPDANRMKLVGMSAAIRSFLASYSGDISGTIQYARKAIGSLTEQELPWRSAALIALGDAFASKGEMAAAYQARSDALVASNATGDTYLLMIANLRMAEVLRYQGKLQQIIEICQQQMQNAIESGLSETVVAGWLLGIWGEVLAELNDLDRAFELAKKGVELAERGQDVAMIGWSNLCYLRVLFSRGDMAAASDLIHRMENLAQDYDMPSWIPTQFSAWQTRIWLTEDKLATASLWLKDQILDSHGDLPYLHEMEYIATARVLIAQKQPEDAVELLQRLLSGAQKGGRTSRMIEILNVQALAFQAKSDLDHAVEFVVQSLTLANPGGFVRTFVDEGPLMARLLYEALKQEIMPAYVQKLLAAFPEITSDNAKSPEPQSPEGDWVEPLSEREIEVLQLISEGLTNQEIAARLYLSANTVKVHTRNIYVKLNVNHRAQAVARARTLGILSTG